jgi:two-component system, LytTR family, response regulator LytT
MKMRCLIVEDEPIAQEILKGYIERTDFLELTGQFSNAVDAFHYLQTNTIQLLFLDIKMPQMTGIELLKAITHKPKVIITSAYRYYATDAFELDVADYLLKPYPFERFLKGISKVMNDGAILNSSPESNSTERPFIFVKGNRQLHKIYISDILFIESQRDYVKFKIQHHPDIISRQTIGYYEEFLPARLFTRVHRSFIVAKEKISLIESTRVLIGDLAIPVGRNYRQQVQSLIKDIST